MNANGPNVLLIFTDQQRADTISALGNPVIRTRNLDRLCAGGTAFTSAFTPSPICVPARCCMKYGGYTHNTGCSANAHPMPQDGARPTFMTALTEAGYRTHGVGKCHFHPQPHSMRGFQTRVRQEEIVRSPDEDEYLKFLHDNGFDYICDPHGVRGEMFYIPQVAQMPAKFHPTQWVGDQTLQFLEEQSQKKEPWFCFTSFIHPHPPFAPPNPWHKLYRAMEMPLPKVPQDVASLQTYINHLQNHTKHRAQGIDQSLLRCMKAYYYACISFIDYQIGRILDHLEKCGDIDNTLIIFTSDHGELLGDYNCFGKRSMHDAPARVPLVVRQPNRFECGSICNRVTSLVDVAPTILAVTGAEMDSDTLDGVDLAEVATGTCSRKMVFSQYLWEERATYMAVSDRWKYFYSAPDNKEFLLDRIKDPLETRNKAGVPMYEDAQEEMKRALIDHLRKGGETKGLEGDDWKEFPKPKLFDHPDEGLRSHSHRWADIHIPGYSD